MMNSRNVLQMVVAGVLCAVGIAIPMFMPKIVLGPMSFTLASHVPVFLAMFISPLVAIAVCAGSTVGFFMSAPLIIALRATSHLVFAFVGAWLLQRYPQIMEKNILMIALNVVLAFIHAVGEVVVVSPFFMGGLNFNPDQLAAGYMTSVIVLVGGGTFIHSIIDFSLAFMLWKIIVKAVPSVKNLR